MNIKYYDIKTINKKIDTNLKKLIIDNESRYRGQLFKIADRVIKQGVRMILLAGPSCAGKTTSSRLLKEILELKGRDVVAISMDDFFIDLAKRPILENGKPDFESPNILNYDLMKKCFSSFFEGKETWFPRYDFKEGKNYAEGYKLKTTYNTIVIFEGLHVLNPRLIDSIGTNRFFKVYIGAMNSYALGRDRMTTKDLRLLRRTVRDIERRGYSPKQTLDVWPEVVSAEVQFIDPYRNNVDFYIDTMHEFELGIFRAEIDRYISEGRMSHEDIPFPQFVNAVTPIDKRLLPATTLMWEFVDPPKEN